MKYFIRHVSAVIKGDSHAPKRIAVNPFYCTYASFPVIFELLENTKKILRKSNAIPPLILILNFCFQFQKLMTIAQRAVCTCNSNGIGVLTFVCMVFDSNRLRSTSRCTNCARFFFYSCT